MTAIPPANLRHHTHVDGGDKPETRLNEWVKETMRTKHLPVTQPSTPKNDVKAFLAKRIEESSLNGNPIPQQGSNKTTSPPAEKHHPTPQCPDNDTQ